MRCIALDGAAIETEHPEPPQWGSISLSSILADSRAAPANRLRCQEPGEVQSIMVISTLAGRLL